jgi:hypothetical protein
MATSPAEKLPLPENDREKIGTRPASPQPETKPSDFVIKTAGAVPA